MAAMGKAPAFQFYPGDWLRDPVSGCSLAAQGLWLRLMFLAHDAERYGYLAINGAPIPDDNLARRCGASVEDFRVLLAELERAGVPRRTPDGTIYSKRMVEDAKAREATKSRVGKHREKHSCNADVTPVKRDCNTPLHSSTSSSSSGIPNGIPPPAPCSDGEALDKAISEFIVQWNRTPGTLHHNRNFLLRDDRERFAMIGELELGRAMAKFPLKCGTKFTLRNFLKPENFQNVVDGAFDWEKTNAKPIGDPAASMATRNRPTRPPQPAT